MKRLVFVFSVFATMALTAVSWGQVGPPPGIPAAPVAAPAAPGNLWSFLLPNAEQKAACKECYCNSFIGQMVQGMVGPLSMMTGGMTKSRCAKFSMMNDLKKPADSPEGAAALVAKDEAEAKARRAAVRILGTVDCNYWPEASDTLKTALRKDRNECVRFEAALALRNGCCCNKETIKALEMSATGSDADGFPAERSDRVRAVAAEALSRCPQIVVEEDRKDIKVVRNAGPKISPAVYYKKVAEMSDDQVIASARAALVSLQQQGRVQPAGGETGPVASPNAGPVVGPVNGVPTRNGSLVGIVSYAFSPSMDGQSRAPFFSNLTRSLTGKQESSVQQYTVPNMPPMQAMPMPNQRVLDLDKTTPVEVTPVNPMPETLPPLRDKKLPSLSSPETKVSSGYIQVSPHVRQVSQPGVERKSGVLIDFIPPAAESPANLAQPSAANSAPAPQIFQSNPTLPRESRGVVVIEEN